MAQAIPTAAQDALLAALLQAASTAEQQLVTLTSDLGPQNSEVIKVKRQIDDLHIKVKNRVDGIMLGLEARAMSLSNSLDNLEHEVSVATRNDVARANESRSYFEAKRNLEDLQHFRQVLDIKIASEKLDVAPSIVEAVDIIDRALPALHPIPASQLEGSGLLALGVLLDSLGLLMLKGRAGAGSEVRAA